MNGFRSVGVLGVICLAVGVGCTGTVATDSKKDKTVSTVEPESKIESSVAKKPQAREPESVEIPLEQMAGLWRRGLRTLEPDLLFYLDMPEKHKKDYTSKGMEIMRHKLSQSLVIPIEEAMYDLPHRKARPYPGFAVQGRDREALPGVHRVLVEGEQPNQFFSSEEEVSLVFFTHRSGSDIRLDRVVRKGNKIEIRYMMIANNRSSGGWNLIFIPCGKLPVGEYQVEMIRSVAREKEVTQPGLRPLHLSLGEGTVCKSFAFSVVNPPVDNSSPIEHIKLRDIWASDMPRTKDIYKLEREAYDSEKLPRPPFADTLIAQIQQAQREPLRKIEGGGIENIQRRGFVVEGRGIDALRAIHRVLVKKEAPQTVFRAGTELSLCFYSLQAGTYVHLTSVLKQKNRIELHYYFWAHFQSVMSDHFAMIPLTYSDKGEVSVEIIQDPNLWRQTISWEPGDPMILKTNDEWGEDLICRPFSFVIE